MVHVQVIQHNFKDLSPGNTQGYFIKNYVMTMLTRSSVQRRQEIIDLVNGGRRINSSGKGNALLHGLHPAGSNSAVLFLEAILPVLALTLHTVFKFGDSFY